MNTNDQVFILNNYVNYTENYAIDNKYKDCKIDYINYVDNDDSLIMSCCFFIKSDIGKKNEHKFVYKNNNVYYNGLKNWIDYAIEQNTNINNNIKLLIYTDSYSIKQQENADDIEQLYVLKNMNKKEYNNIIIGIVNFTDFANVITIDNNNYISHKNTFQTLIRFIPYFNTTNNKNNTVTNNYIFSIDQDNVQVITESFFVDYKKYIVYIFEQCKFYKQDAFLFINEILEKLDHTDYKKFNNNLLNGINYITNIWAGIICIKIKLDFSLLYDFLVSFNKNNMNSNNCDNSNDNILKLFVHKVKNMKLSEYTDNMFYYGCDQFFLNYY